MSTKRVFSGIQPSGDIHIGNYMGALRNWVAMQDDYATIYCVVDLHALTLPQDPARLLQARLRTAKILLAAGIDPHHSMLYFQSQVPQHSELSWIMGTLASMGHLGRMTQYKEKEDKGGQNLGLFSYPVLMAADILIHRVHAVPVGNDQTQHLEFTRDLVGRFNARYGDFFPLPEQISPPVGARVMSLQDPSSKMSKSDPDPGSRIIVTDDADTIVSKLRRAVTDSGREVAYDLEEKPGISNLLDILAAFTGRGVAQLAEEYAQVGYGRFKDVVAEAVIFGLQPLRQAYLNLEDAQVKQIMDEGARQARTRAEETMTALRSLIGLSD
ncbi:MAG: tryptophan--tRNA ligase [Acidimicrobiia bacterium]|nr:tryptophan--tRNA ligase [Acidimicrobiia bacterium]